MREKLQPWIPAIFCVCLSVITVVSWVVQSNILKGAKGDPRILNIGVLAPFLSFLPVCFLHVGTFMSQLREENRELRKQIQELISKSGA